MEQVVTAAFLELVAEANGAFDDQLASFFAPAEELAYSVRMPLARAQSGPVGALVYISPKSGASMPQSWADVLDAHNLIWIGALNSGNEVHVGRRAGLALLARAVAKRVTGTEVSRVVLTGFSGGGRVASMMMPAYSAQFSSAVFICGANPLMTNSPDEITGLAQTPMVFLTGTDDFNLRDTQMAITSYQVSGLERVNLTIVDGLGHALPEGQDIDIALRLLDRN